MVKSTASKYVTIRLGKPESEALTRIRAARELRTSVRITIKEVIREIIAEGFEKYLDGVLVLPVEKTVPELVNGSAVERISYTKSHDDHAALAQMRVRADGSPVEYGDADIIRELIQVFDVENFYAPPKRLRSPN